MQVLRPHGEHPRQGVKLGGSTGGGRHGKEGLVGEGVLVEAKRDGGEGEAVGGRRPRHGGHLHAPEDGLPGFEHLADFRHHPARLRVRGVHLQGMARAQDRASVVRGLQHHPCPGHHAPLIPATIAPIPSPAEACHDCNEKEDPGKSPRVKEQRQAERLVRAIVWIRHAQGISKG